MRCVTTFNHIQVLQLQACVRVTYSHTYLSAVCYSVAASLFIAYSVWCLVGASLLLWWLTDGLWWPCVQLTSNDVCHTFQGWFSIWNTLLFHYKYKYNFFNMFYDMVTVSFDILPWMFLVQHSTNLAAQHLGFWKRASISMCNILFLTWVQRLKYIPEGWRLTSSFRQK